LKSCPKCGGAMEKRGKGSDHNLRVEDRHVLKVRHERRLVARSTRPLMYVCEKCGYVEFYVPMEFGKATGRKVKDNERKGPTQGRGEYYT
jgi:DNA-directed RNA polymerase subunit M/transcription elongation factor TFIIS